jgi:ABC-type multidrug transport system fused ATPase/permease subunit
LDRREKQSDEFYYQDKKENASHEKYKSNASGPSVTDIGGYKYETLPPPKSLRDVPGYLRELFSGFFSRFHYIFSLVWKTGPWILLFMIFLSLFNGVMPVVGSLISKEILNELQNMVTGRALGNVIGDFFASPVMFLLVFLFIYRILNRVLTRLDTSVTRIAGELVVRRVKLQIMEKACEIDLAAFDLPEFYEKLENANREAGNRPVTILSSTFSVVSTFISLFSYILILSSELPLAAICIFVISIPSAIVNFVYRRKHFGYMRFRSKERRQMNYYSGVLVNKDLAKEIRMYHLGDTFMDKYKNVFDTYYKGLYRLIIHEGIWAISIAFLSAIVNCLFYLLIAYRVFTGDYMIGDYSLYTGALVSIASNIAALINTSATVYEGTLFIDNLISFMKTKPHIKSILPTPRSVVRGAHTIEFDRVSFSYPGTDIEVIHDVSFRIDAGETVALVGFNGAGKTTLIKLLTRLYDPTKGRILLDGVDIREYDPEKLYDIFGIIFQDFGKYACSVSENIMFGDINLGVDNQKIEQAAVSANADEFIRRLPNGYDTALMRFFERSGIELSGGQWQKLSVARAFYSDSDILILDEPTASLDAIAEQEIYNQFDDLRKDKTTIFVSHRLSSATSADKIIVLENGQILEEGDHKQLMAKEGRYYELFTTQAKHYVEASTGKI